jgi:hypothetical protein
MGVARVVVMAALLAGCIEYHEYKDTLRVPSGVVAEYTGHFFLFGVIGNADLNVYEQCPNGVYRIISKKTGVDTLISVFTLGMYMPRSYRVDCAA